MRRAEWRRPLGEPQRGIGLLYTAALDALKLPLVQVACAFFLAVTFVAALLVSLLLATSLLSKGSVLGFIAILLVGALIFFLGRVVLKHEARPLERRVNGLEPLLPLPLPDHTFPVYVAIRFLGTLTALDVAAVSFVDGWLHVDGRRASYAVHAGDGRAEWRNGSHLRVDLPGRQSIALWHVDSPCSVGTQAYFSQSQRKKETREGVGAPSIGNQAFFRHHATLWAADREHPEGESVLPPLGVYPTIRALWSFATLLSGLLLGLVPILVRWPGGARSAAFVVVSFALGTGMLFLVASAAPKLGEARKRDQALLSGAIVGNRPPS